MGCLEVEWGVWRLSGCLEVEWGVWRLSECLRLSEVFGG